MPTGEGVAHPRRRVGHQRGFTYLLLLFAMVIAGIGLAALGEQARQRALREQEAELAFRGTEIARAIASYADASPAGSRSLPSSVEELLEDRRSGRVVRHLRQLRADPLAAQPDGAWVWLSPGEGGCSTPPRSGPAALGLSAVRSASTRALLKRESDAPKPACDQVFRHEAYRQTATKPAASAPV